MFPLTNFGVDVESWVREITLTPKQAIKRDMELVRKILQYAVEQRIPSSSPVSFDGYDNNIIDFYTLQRQQMLFF